jgi:steroid 5-alpha reductase family enzyme
MSTILVTILVYQTLVFIAAKKLNRIDFIDLGWPVGFMLIALTGYLQHFSTPAKFTLLFMILIWGLRLALYLTYRWKNKAEDKRYAHYRSLWGDANWKKFYTHLYLPQAGFMFLISLPLQLGMSGDHDQLGPKHFLALLLFFCGVFLESWADFTLSEFKKNPKNMSFICQTGPWKIIRFPHYLGEILVWWSLYIYVLNFWSAWTLVGPLFLTYSLLKFTGIPLTEKRYHDDPNYQLYSQQTKKLIPFVY